MEVSLNTVVLNIGSGHEKHGIPLLRASNLPVYIFRLTTASLL